LDARPAGWAAIASAWDPLGQAVHLSRRFDYNTVMTVRVTTDPIDYVALVEGARSPASGAVVLFLGTVRDVSEGRQVRWLEYESYPTMAEKKLGEILAEAHRRWPLHCAFVHHRYGRLELKDVAVAVVTASEHRAAAFAAAAWTMDTIKQMVPIWKKENWAEGGAEWVHPAHGVTSSSAMSNG
jgi:molybdopterin synthase catalytic subunit